MFSDVIALPNFFLKPEATISKGHDIICLFLRLTQNRDSVLIACVARRMTDGRDLSKAESLCEGLYLS
jgi:hypothetical protein